MSIDHPACIFLGPSAPVADARALFPQACYLPPAQQGDVAAVVNARQPIAIGIVDGYFLQRPSIWHKEILWAMSLGVTVHGAASMGALRAAELAPLGMRGIGRIFDGFLDGALPPFGGLNSDDEVAVVHGPVETGYLSVTDALVNIRSTLASAQSAGVIDERVHAALLEGARQLHYTQRTYDRVLQGASDSGVAAAPIERLRQWLTTGKVDQKRLDALQLVRVMRECHEGSPGPHEACFQFEATEIWSGALPEMLASGPRPSAESIRHNEDMLAVLHEDIALYESVKRSALLRLLLQEIGTPESDDRNEASGAGQESVLADLSVDRVAVRRTIDTFRQEHELWDREAIDGWLNAQQLELSRWESLMQTEAKLAQLLDEPLSPTLTQAMVDHLRMTGQFERISAGVAKVAEAP